MTGGPEQGRPVIFGEVLYDVFPDGTSVLGGAPFNVAWHLQGLGQAPLFVSRVGRDKLGDRILHAMDEWGMDSYAVSQDSSHLTGQVQVSLQSGQPAFDIVPDVAYDHIPIAGIKNLYQNTTYGILYHGSLIARMPVSRQSLSILRNHAPAIFVDINLRAPWWSKEQLDELLQGINWLKINDVELQVLSGCSVENGRSIESAARDMLNTYGWKAVIVTRGAEGAMLITDGNSHHIAPAKVKRMVDTVGAGDGFSAVWLVGLLKDWHEEMILERAVEFAADICQLRGAVSQDREFYRRYTQRWML